MSAAGPPPPALSPSRLDAVVFDMDGVVTDTARVHSAAWKLMFDDWLRERAAQSGTPFEPFTPEDYRRYVDGKRREDGVAAFLASRGIELPPGHADDPPDRETLAGLGARKNAYFLQRLRTDGTDAYPGTVALVRALQAAGIGTAIITASRNCDDVLAAAGIPDLFPVRVDGQVAAQLGLPGKPDPAVFVEAARRLGASPRRTAVVEDALAGVEAGRRGGFALVVGVDRTGHAEELRRAGADLVVGDLAELRVDREDAPAAEAGWAP